MRPLNKRDAIHASQTHGWNLLLEQPWPVPMPRMSVAPSSTGPAGDVLVVVFLRGAADGLNIVVPHGDETYYIARPTIAVHRPDDTKISAPNRAVDLDGFFGLHPALNSLMDAWVDEELALVQACGSPEDSHSHFRAMEYMERGVVQAVGPASGWINRHLASLETGNPSPLRAVGWGESVQRSLQGSIPVTALQSITEAHLGGNQRATDVFRSTLGILYENDPMLDELGIETLDVISALEKLKPENYRTSGDRAYPENIFGQGMKQLAMLIKAEIGLEVAAIDLGGWDTHFAQGGAEGLMANLLRSLADGMAAFHADLGSLMKRVTVVVMTEFGRRVAENASLGTDHGHGSVMLLLGGGVRGGRVYADWPGLEPGKLFGPGDLPVTTDYRDVLSEVIHLRLGNTALEETFPGFTPAKSGFVKPR